jgi:hypothetical protein
MHSPITDAGIDWASRSHAVCIIDEDGSAIERFEVELRVVVIASRGVKALRTRYGSAGNKDDRADAYVLADVLRTDGHRLRRIGN